MSALGAFMSEYQNQLPDAHAVERWHHETASQPYCLMNIDLAVALGGSTADEVSTVVVPTFDFALPLAARRGAADDDDDFEDEDLDDEDLDDEDFDDDDFDDEDFDDEDFDDLDDDDLDDDDDYFEDSQRTWVVTAKNRWMSSLN